MFRLMGVEVGNAPGHMVRAFPERCYRLLKQRVRHTFSARNTE
jgi:hypothetical protein